jgi:S-disulfanyl-L-cysteine oxidoreductase SoxD
MLWSAGVAVPYFLLPSPSLAQAPDYKNVGRAPTDAELRGWDIAVGPEGKELPSGHGTAKEGAALYAKKCTACHGQKLEGSQFGPALIGGKGSLNTTKPLRTVGSYWAFATTLYDYINRAMPRNAEGTLSPDEVYALAAFLLYKNDIIKEAVVMDQKSLPKVQMPNRHGFKPERFEDIPKFEKRGCKVGLCP